MLPRAHSSKGWIFPERGKEGAVGQVPNPRAMCLLDETERNVDGACVL
jgi:hypothetical protein